MSLNKTSKIEFSSSYWLLTILVIAFVLRIWGIWNADSTDEYNEVFEALRVCSGNLNFERWFKRFYLYILAIEYGVYYIFGWIFNFFQSPDDFAAKIIRDPYPLFILGRITSVILGTGSVWLTYLIGKHLYNRSVGLIAALFLCFNVVNIELSHYARVDACLGFMVLAAFFWIAKISSEKAPPIIWYALAGTLAGVAFQNKMQAIILLFPFAFAYFSKFRVSNYLNALFSKEILTFGVSYIVGLVIGNPAVLFAPINFVQGLIGWGSGAYTTPVNETVFKIGYIVYLQYFLKELGLPQVILAIMSLMLALFLPKKRELLLLSFILPFYGLMGGSKYLVSSSYMIPLMPLLYILMAGTLSKVMDRLQPSRIKTVITAAILIILMSYPVVHVWKLGQSFTGKNTRVLAKEWIEENIPYGSKLLMDSGKTINSFAPLIAENEISIQRTLNRKTEEISSNRLKDTTKMVDQNSLRYFEILLQTVPEQSYDITSTQFGLQVQSIDYYVKHGFQYFIISEEMKKSRTTLAFAKRNPDVSSFYSFLDTHNHIKLIKKIIPSHKNMGQVYLIYKL